MTNHRPDPNETKLLLSVEPTAFLRHDQVHAGCYSGAGSLKDQKTSEPTLQQADSILVSVCSFLLFSELLGSFGLSGLTGSLAIFFRRHLGMTNAFATELSSAFLSLYYCTPLLGGYIADKWLGPLNTMMRFYPILVMGLALCVIGAIPWIDSAWLCLLGLLGFAFGSGGVNSIVVVLGADQFDVNLPSQRAEKESFFNWLYWVWGLGAALSFATLTNLAVNGLEPLISAHSGFFALFCICLSAYSTAFAAVYCGKPRYRQLARQGGIELETFCTVVLQAGMRTCRGRLVLSGMFAFGPGVVLTGMSCLVQPGSSWHLTLALAGALNVFYGVVVLIGSANSTNWLHDALRIHGGSFGESQVYNVTQVMRLIPYMSFAIIFWTAYAQQTTNFVFQGCQMDLRYGVRESTPAPSPSLVSSAMLSILETLVIVVLVPVFDRVVFPFLTNSCGIQVTSLRKIGVGLLCTCLSMVLAGWLEVERKTRGLVVGSVSNCTDSIAKLPMSSISVWWQTPQYLLIGLAEILVSISSHELFYTEGLESMRSVCQSLTVLTTSLGFIVAGGINSLLTQWIPSDLNDGKLENVFFCIAFIAFINLIAFGWISQHFQYRSRSQEVQL